MLALSVLLVISDFLFLFLRYVIGFLSLILLYSVLLLLSFLVVMVVVLPLLPLKDLSFEFVRIALESFYEFLYLSVSQVRVADLKL